VPKHNDRLGRCPDPESEARERLRAARRVIDDMLTGRRPAGLVEVARAAHLVEQARDLLWASTWRGVA
jgi:hypothetical protein